MRALRPLRGPGAVRGRLMPLTETYENIRIWLTRCSIYAYISNVSMTGVDICMLCLCMTPLCICVNIHVYRRTGLRHSKDSF